MEGAEPGAANASTSLATTATWVGVVQRLIAEEYDLSALSWTTWSQGTSNYRDYIERASAGQVRQKKYVHVARKVLLYYWLQAYQAKSSDGGFAWPPPLRVLNLLEAVRDTVPTTVVTELHSMLAPGALGLLACTGPRRAILDDWIQSSFADMRRRLPKRTKARPGGSRAPTAGERGWDDLLIKLIGSTCDF